MPWDFPGGAVVKNTLFNAGDMGLIPGWGTRIPQALEQLGLCAQGRSIYFSIGLTLVNK